MTRKIILILLLLSLVSLLFIAYTSDKLLDWLWFRSLKLTEVFWTPLLTGVFTKIILGLGFFLFLFFNLNLTRKAYTELKSEINVTGKQHLTISALTAFVLTLFLLPGFTYDWALIQQFLHRTEVGTVDPIFGLDLSFYLFVFPLLQKLYLLVMALVILSFLSVFVSYLIAQAYWYQEKHFQLWPRARIHLTLLGVFFLLTKAGGYYLNRFNLLFAEGSLLTGVDFTSHRVRILGSNILIVIALISAAFLLWSIFNKRHVRLLIIGIGLWLAVSFLTGALLPQIVENLYVKPNQYIVEEPYILNHINLTRYGYGLHQIKEKTFSPGFAEDFAPQTADVPFDPKGNLEASKIPADSIGAPTAGAFTAGAFTLEHPSLKNLRIWDYRPLLTVYNQLQSIRTYYTFNDIDIDRYETPAGQRQVMLAAREIDPTRLPPGANNWLNLHLTYTHGYGLAMNLVNETTSEGQPFFVVKNLPPKIEPEFLNTTIQRPEIYFGEINNDYIVVNTKQKELDYSLGEANETTTYQGKSGISLRRLSVRLLLAMKLREKNLILSGYINHGSRIILNRRIQERVKKIAPFLSYDQDPYLVLADGRLFWILDAYTLSSYLPYSKRHNHGFNYIRNSIKVVVDAYNGTVDFYLVDEEDAIAKTWQKIFPRLVKGIDKMPEELRKHLRYSESLFTIQREQLLTYHITDPKVFYEKEDYWSLPTQIYDDREELMEPYYITLSLPGEAKSEFLLMQSFTPSGKRNMISWLAARCDGENYGEMLLYKLPKDTNIYGPMQIEARIGQNPEITQLIAWWNQNQSRLIRGNLITIPVAGAFLYAEPFYIVSEQGQIPELKKIILAYGEKIVMGDNLDEALAKLGGVYEGEPTGRQEGEESALQREKPLEATEPVEEEVQAAPPLKSEEKYKEIITKIEEKLQEVEELLKTLKEPRAGTE